MLRLFFDLKTKQGQRVETVTGICQQNLHLLLNLKQAGLETCQVQEFAQRKKGQTQSYAAKCCIYSPVGNCANPWMG